MLSIASNLLDRAEPTLDLFKGWETPEPYPYVPRCERLQSAIKQRQGGAARRDVASTLLSTLLE